LHSYFNGGIRHKMKGTKMKLLQPMLVASAALSAFAQEMDISTGRQLFVDDYLVESTTNVVRHWNRPVKEDAPVIWHGLPGAVPSKLSDARKILGPEDAEANTTAATDGGLWWDPTRKKFRLWYMADFYGDICYAESDDCEKWTFPDLGIVPGTNRLFEHNSFDSWNVMPNYAAKNPYADWKLYKSERGCWTEDSLWESPDGLHFKNLGVVGRSRDRSTMYFDPFRGVWVFSLRENMKGLARCRRYFEMREFRGDKRLWSWPGDKTEPEEFKGLPQPELWIVVKKNKKRSQQLYNFSAVAYESLLLGVMEVLYSMPGDNTPCEKAGLPKQTALHFSFSRDGKAYTPPREDADIPPEGWGSGKWDTGFLSPIGGICVIRDERLCFYYSGFRGDGERLSKSHASGARNGMYSNGSIGVATLRRDGFAGMVADATGEILTKPVVFSGKRLFVNAECRFGSVAAEIVGEDGKAIRGFTFEDCKAFAKADSTKTELKFKGGDLSSLAGKPVRFRFRIHCGTLYSFWVSPSARGESRGYVAAGGPAYSGLRDL